MSNLAGRSPEDPAEDGGAFDELPDGSGCFEIWEHLSKVRDEAAGD